MSSIINRHMAGGVFALLLSACADETSDEGAVPPLAEEIENECPVASSNWQAWVNKMPGPGEPKLHVIGDIEFAKPGMAASLSLGPLDRRRPPSQRVIMNVRKSDGAEEIRQSINANFPALAGDYRSVVIVCGGNEIATITDIEVAQ